MEITLLCSDPEERRAVLEQLAARLPLRVGDAGLGGAREWIWWHEGAGSPALESSATERSIARRIREHLELGARVLVSGALARHVDLLASESELPELRTNDAGRSERPPMARGVVALPGEPMFARFGSQVLLSVRRPGIACRVATYRHGRRPALGKLLAVTGKPGRVNSEEGVLWAHANGRGRLLCIGAHLVFADLSCAGQAEHRETRARFCGDMIDWLGNDAAQSRTRGWPTQKRTLELTVVPNRSNDVPRPETAAPGSEPTRALVREHGQVRFELWSAGEVQLVSNPWEFGGLEIAIAEQTGGLEIGLGLGAMDHQASEPPSEPPAERPAERPAELLESPADGSPPDIVANCSVSPSRMLRELHSVGFVIEQEVVADADGFAFRLRNNSERAARGSFTIACRSASVCKLVGAPTGSLAVATTADGREIRIDDDALGAAWCLSWPQPPLSRGITAFGASAAGVRIERAFELLPGRSIEMGLATRWLATPWLAKPAGGLVAAEPTRLAFSGHDQATDGEFEWMFARLARAPLSFMDAVRLGHHAEAEAWLEVRLRTTHGAQAALDCERALALIAWTGTARQPKVLWPGLCRILAQWIAIGADATDGRTWRAAALVARAMGDGGLARICTANAKCSSRTPVPECSDELDLVTAYPRGSPADAAQQSFSAIVGHVIGARVALERMEVELAPSPTRWPRFAFAGLVLQGHQIAGELEWSDDQCSLKMTLLATPLAATTEPATTQPLELELAPHLLASKELADGDFARVTSDGMPIECRSEPDETGFRARVRCRILGAIELSFTSRAETRAPLA